MKNNKSFRLYVPVAPQFAQDETAEGFLVEVRPVISYAGSKFSQHSCTGLRRVLYT